MWWTVVIGLIVIFCAIEMLRAAAENMKQLSREEARPVPFRRVNPAVVRPKYVDEEEEAKKLTLVVMTVFHDLIADGWVTAPDPTTPKAIAEGDQLIREGVIPTPIDVSDVLVAYGRHYGVNMHLPHVRDLIIHRLEEMAKERENGLGDS